MVNLQVTPTGSTDYVWQLPTLAPGESGTIVMTGIIDPNFGDGLTVTNTVDIQAGSILGVL